MSKNITPTLWVRLLRKNRAIAFGLYPNFRAASSIFFLVAGAIYRARGALFRTMETVAGEKPLEFATSLIVTAADLPDGRFTGFSAPASLGRIVPLCNGCFISVNPSALRMIAAF